MHTLKTDHQKTGRTEPRQIVDKFYSVEFAVDGVESIYQFKIWNISTNGMCILVREDSALLPHLSEGDVFRMKYYANEPVGTMEHLKTEVKHITRDAQGRFRGHFLVGLSIIDKDNGSITRH